MSQTPSFHLLQGLELAVPGTYLIGEPVVTIAAFAQQLHVITSKQRPRKLTIHGSDGAEYMFLLKGHEDLRQARGLSTVAACECCSSASNSRVGAALWQRNLLLACCHHTNSSNAATAVLSTHFTACQHGSRSLK